MEKYSRVIESNSQIGRQNPFSQALSGYGYMDNGTLVSVYSLDSHEYSFQLEAHSKLRDFVLEPDFVCIAAKSAVRHSEYAFCSYKDMRSKDVAEGVCHDLYRYTQEFPFGNPYNSFFACFEQSGIATEAEGIVAFYTLLQNMYEVNVELFQGTDSKHLQELLDHESKNEGFPILDKKFFPILLGPNTGSLDRRIDSDIVVFNSVDVFNELRRRGAFDRLKKIIRGRMKYVHPYMQDHGTGKYSDELIQYTLATPEAQKSEVEARMKILGGSCPFAHSK